MTPAALAHIENRADLARRLTHEILRRAAELHVETDRAQVIWFFEDLRDSERFLIWRAVRASKCPSDETWGAVRNLLLDRLSLDEKLRLIGPSFGDHAEAEVYEARERTAPDDAAVVATHDLAGTP